MGPREGSPEKEVHNYTGVPEKNRNVSNKQPNPTPIRTQGTTTKTTQSKHREGNKQDQSRVKGHRD